MRTFVNVGYFREGNSDDEFFRILLFRTMERIVSPDIELADPAWMEPIALAVRNPERIADEVEQKADRFTLVAIHADCKARTRADVHAEWVLPSVHRVAARAHDIRVVGILPVQEMEAWALADPEALRRALGVTHRFDLPNPVGDPRELEREPNPKAIFTRLVQTAKRSAIARSDPKPYLAAVAREVDLDVLARMTAFAAFREDLHDALRALRLAD